MGARLIVEGELGPRVMEKQGDGLHPRGTSEYIEAVAVGPDGGGAIIKIRINHEEGLLGISAGQVLGPYRIGMKPDAVTIIGT